MANDLVLTFKTTTDTKAAQDAILALHKRVDDLAAAMSRAMAPLSKGQPGNIPADNKAALSAAQLAAAQARAATAAQAQTAAQNRAAASAINLGASQTRAATATQILTAAQARATTATANLGAAQARQAAAQARAAVASLSLAAAQNRAAGSGSNLTSGLSILQQQLGGFNAALPFSVTGTGALAGGVVALGVAAVRSATELDSLKRGLIAVSGSSSEAEKQLIRLREVAKLPGLSFKEAIEGSVRLQAAGISAQLAERSLRGFGNALATLGRGSEELGGIIRALSQIQAKGKVQAEEINQIAERLPQIRVLMQQAFGTARTEEIQKMNLSSSQFLEKLVEQLEKLPKVTGGPKVAFENLKDAAFVALSEIGNEMLPSVMRAVNELTKDIEKGGEGWRQLGRDMGEVIGVTASLISWIDSLGNALKSVGDIANVIGGDLNNALMRVPYLNDALTQLKIYTRAAGLTTSGKKPAVINTELRGVDLMAELKAHQNRGGGGGGGSRKGGGGGRKGRDTSQQELQERIRLLDLELRAVESNLDREVDANERAYALRTASLQEYAAEAIRLENARWQKQRETLLKEIADISAHDKDREVKVKEFSLKLVEAELASAKKIQEIRDEQDRKERDARRAHAEGLIRIQEASDKNQIARINRLAEDRAISAEQAESKIAEIELVAFGRRRKLLQDDIAAAEKNKEDTRKLKDELGLMEVELTGIVEGQRIRRRKARDTDVEETREYHQTILRLEREAAAIGRDTTLAILDARLGRSVGGGEGRRQVDERLRIEKEAIDARHEAIIDQLDEEERQELRRVGFAENAEKQRLEIYEKYHHLRVEQKKRHDAETEEAGKKAREGGVKGQIERALGTNTEDFKNGTDFEGLGIDAAIESLTVMEDALKSAGVAWLLYGESVSKAMKKAAAEQAAGLAVEFGMQALKHALYAIGNLAFGRLDQAAKHALAAAKFGAAALALGVGARALSGGGAAGTASSNIAGSETERQIQYAPFNYGNSASPSSAVAGQGSQNVGIWNEIRTAIQANTQELSRIRSMPHGEALAIGASENPAAVGRAVVDHSKSSHDFNMEMLNNYGFAR